MNQSIRVNSSNKVSVEDSSKEKQKRKKIEGTAEGDVITVDDF